MGGGTGPPHRRAKRTGGPVIASEYEYADTARGVVRFRPDGCSGGTAATRVWHGGHHTDRS